MKKFHTTQLLLGLLVIPLSGQAESAQKMNAEQVLGQVLYMDANLSLNRNQSCNSCHIVRPLTGEEISEQVGAVPFVDPDNVKNLTAISKGSVVGALGTLNTPSAAYARFSPYFHWNGDEGLYVGGQFWDGRAATLAEQAKGPPLNPTEMAMPSQWAVVSRLKQNPYYVEHFRSLYGISLDAIPTNEKAAADETPPAGVQEAYDHMAQAIAAFEKTSMFSPFTSKYDFVMAGVTEFTDLERQGLELFNSEKSQCSACHPSTPMKTPDGGMLPPVFTDFTYDNLGIPANVSITGKDAISPGLGGRPVIAALDPHGEQIGKHKVMGLRNIAVTPPYMHNGVITTLEQTVHFYNTRDAKPRQCRDNLDPGFAKDCWPAPEIDKNVNVDELGDLGLSEREEQAIVAFMKTLTDGYPEWGKDAKVPPGTPSPFANIPLPPAP